MAYYCDTVYVTVARDRSVGEGWIGDTYIALLDSCFSDAWLNGKRFASLKGARKRVSVASGVWYELPYTAAGKVLIKEARHNC